MVVPLLSLSKISKSFSDVLVLRDVSFSVLKGECVGIVGASGCGKSTLFRIILGYFSSDSGSISLNGELVVDHFLLRKSIGYTTQDDSFYKMLTPLENLEYYARLFNAPYSGKELSNHIASLLRGAGLWDHKDIVVGSLSGGQRRRLNFIISLLHDPSLLLLDEPTTGLDRRLVDSFWGMVLEEKKKGASVLVTSHYLEELEKHCDKVIILKKGVVSKVVSVTRKTDLSSLFAKYS